MQSLRDTIVTTLLRNIALSIAFVALVAMLAPHGQEETPVIVTRSATAPLQLHETFAGAANGATPVAEGVTNFSFHEAAAPTMRGGFLSTADPDRAAGGAYRIAQLGGDVTRVGAEFAFSSYAQAGGVLCLSIQAESIATIDHGVPVSPVHLIVSPTFWSLDVNTERGTGVDTVFRGTFATPLASDSQTLHRVELVLDRAAGRAVLDLPDGNRRILEHPAFALPGAFAYVEPFKTPGLPLAEQANALVSSWWAGAGDVQTQPSTEGEVGYWKTQAGYWEAQSGAFEELYMSYRAVHERMAGIAEQWRARVVGQAETINRQRDRIARLRAKLHAARA